MRFSVSCESLLFTVGGYYLYFSAVSLSGRIILLLSSCNVGLFSLISSMVSNLFFSSIWSSFIDSFEFWEVSSWSGTIFSVLFRSLFWWYIWSSCGHCLCWRYWVLPCFQEYHVCLLICSQFHFLFLYLGFSMLFIFVTAFCWKSYY